jgi:hypothetical protein
MDQPQVRAVRRQLAPDLGSSQIVIFDLFCKDTWSTLAEALGSYLWGDQQKVPVPQTQRAADITEQFETLYARY